jgi:hypothetical protein
MAPEDTPLKKSPPRKKLGPSDSGESGRPFLVGITTAVSVSSQRAQDVRRSREGYFFFLAFLAFFLGAFFAAAFFFLATVRPPKKSLARSAWVTS